MAAIFPPLDKGGVPPGPNVCDGYTPTNPVLGEGPLYVSHDCTTILTDCQLNAITSELLAAVDKLGFSFNTNSITNLADAILSYTGTITANLVHRAGDTMTGPLLVVASTDPASAIPRGQAVLKAGDTMTGELVLAGSPSNLLGAVPKGYVDGTINNVIAQYQSADTALQADINTRVKRAGDTMTGELLLWRHPVDTMEAATKFYVDQQVAAGGGGGGGGIPDAPSDGAGYLRKNNLWAKGVSLGGDTMTGPLILSGPPTASNGAVTKAYADGIATGVAGKVNKGGDTMTGALGVGPAPPGDANAASLFTSYSIAGAFLDNLYGDASGNLKLRAAGYGSFIALDPATGLWTFNISNAAGAAGAVVPPANFNHFTVLPDGALDVPTGLKANTTTDRIRLSNIGEVLQYAINGGAMHPVWGDVPFSGALNSYMKLPNGFIIQWGYMAGGAGAEAIWNVFPTTFPNACLNAQASIVDDGAAGATQLFSVSVHALNPGGFTVRPRYTSGGAVAAAGQPVFWIAIGF